MNAISFIAYRSHSSHTSRVNNQNHPVLPATPRIGRIAAAKRLEITRARFKLDLEQGQVGSDSD